VSTNEKNTTFNDCRQHKQLMNQIAKGTEIYNINALLENRKNWATTTIKRKIKNPFLVSGNNMDMTICLCMCV